MIKTIIEKAGSKVILGALAIILIAALSAGFWAGRKTAPDNTSLIPVSALGSLQDSLKTARAALRSSGDMIITLRKADKTTQIRAQAATIADLKAKLTKLEGGGPADPVETGNEWSVYQDQAMTAFFRQDMKDRKRDSLSYSMNPRPIKITLAEGLNNDWVASAWDVWGNQPAVIESLNVQRNKDWSPPKPWYKKVGTVLKYAGVAAAAGGTGYFIGKAF